MSDNWYDGKEDVHGIQQKSKDCLKSVEVSKNVVVDLSDGGEIIGIEILGDRRSFKRDAPLTVSRALSKKVVIYR